MRRQQNHLSAPACRSGQIDSTASKNRLRLQQHSFSAAERPVIHRLDAGRTSSLSDCEPGFPPPGLARLGDHAVRERPSKEIRENRQHMEDHSDSALPTLPAAPPRFACRPHRPRGRSTGANGISSSAVTLHFQQHRAAHNPASPSPAPIRFAVGSDHLTTDQVRVIELAFRQPAAAPLAEYRRRRPAAFPPPSIVSTPLNLKTSVSSMHPDRSTSHRLRRTIRTVKHGPLQLLKPFAAGSLQRIRRSNFTPDPASTRNKRPA